MNDLARYRLPLPDDPIAQLAVGFVTPPVEVTIPAGGSIVVLVPNPMRAAFYVMPRVKVGPWNVSPVQVPTPAFAGGVEWNAPIPFTTFDYPGMIQLEWTLTANVGDTFVIWEYQLFPWE